MNYKLLILFVIMALVTISSAIAGYHYGSDDQGTYVEADVQITAGMEAGLESLNYVYNVIVFTNGIRVYYNERFLNVDYYVNRILQVIERNTVDVFHLDNGSIIPFCAWDYGRNEKVGFYFNNGQITIVRNHPLC